MDALPPEILRQIKTGASSQSAKNAMAFHRNPLDQVSAPMRTMGLACICRAYLCTSSWRDFDLSDRKNPLKHFAKSKCVALDSDASLLPDPNLPIPHQEEGVKLMTTSALMDSLDRLKSCEHCVRSAIFQSLRNVFMYVSRMNESEVKFQANNKGKTLPLTITASAKGEAPFKVSLGNHSVLMLKHQIATPEQELLKQYILKELNLALSSPNAIEGFLSDNAEGSKIEVSLVLRTQLSRRLPNQKEFDEIQNQEEQYFDSHFNPRKQ